MSNAGYVLGDDGKWLLRLPAMDVRGTLKDYRDILMEVAAYYAIPVLDLWATSGMQPEVEACREHLMPDGLHPSDEGHAIIAHRLGEFLKTL